MNIPTSFLSRFNFPKSGCLVLPIVALFSLSANAATFFVSPSGSDLNSGSQFSPFRSITKAQAVASSGDTVLLRGGTYSTFIIGGSDSNYNFVHNITKSGITYAAFTGETPSFDFSSISTEKRVAAFHIAKGVTGVTFRGFQVTGVPVGSQKQSECFRVEGAAAFDQVVCHDNAANGFYFTTNGSGSCTNCDSFNNIGSTSASIGNTDGFGAHAFGVVFTSCRSWHNSDDGFDCISSTRSNTFDHCWAYNMTAGGDSNGFKIGGFGLTGAVANPMPSHVVQFCLSANNNAHGFYANHQPGMSATWTNNTAYNNRSANFDMLEQASPTDRTDIPGTREVLHNNLAFTGRTIINDNNPPENTTNNSWTLSGVTVTAADFESLDVTQMTSPRQADGSLPVIAFMHLTHDSPLAGLGCFVGIENSAPAVSLISPSNNATFAAGTNIIINAAASDNDGSVSQVDFFQGAVLLGSAVSAPYSFNWTGVPAGVYSLTATATDNRGAVTSSSVISISVAAGPVVYQAEDGIWDSTSVLETLNPGWTGTGYINTGPAVGAFSEVTVSVPTTGIYTLDFRYANGTPTSRPADLRINGALVQASVPFAGTGGWSIWRDVVITRILMAGANTVRLTATTASGCANLDKVTVQ